jgi:hypothetical protein
MFRKYLYRVLAINLPLLWSEGVGGRGKIDGIARYSNPHPDPPPSRGRKKPIS